MGAPWNYTPSAKLRVFATCAARHQPSLLSRLPDPSTLQRRLAGPQRSLTLRSRGGGTLHCSRRTMRHQCSAASHRLAPRLQSPPTCSSWHCRHRDGSESAAASSPNLSACCVCASSSVAATITTEQGTWAVSAATARPDGTHVPVGGHAAAASATATGSLAMPAALQVWIQGRCEAPVKVYSQFTTTTKNTIDHTFCEQLPLITSSAIVRNL